MFTRAHIVIEKPFEFVYRASIPAAELFGYGFSEEKAIEHLEKHYNQYLDHFLDQQGGNCQPTVQNEFPFALDH